MQTPSKTKKITKIIISLFPVLMGLWLPFIHLFLLNSSNLTLPFSVHISTIALISAIAIFSFLALQTITPSWIRKFVSYFLLLCGIFFWAENTLFIGDFGFLKGGEIDWAQNQYILYLELLLLGSMVLLVFKFKGRLIKNAGWITMILLLSSLANIYPAFQTFQARTKSTTKHTFTMEDVFRLSPEKNVILFIVDTYQADLFADIIAENPKWKSVFDGFTFFPNATSAFPRTYASIPDILTGQAFENDQPFPHFLQSAYLGNSAPKILKEQGFDVRYRSFTWQPYFAHPDVADNLAGIGDSDAQQWMRGNEFIQLANLTLFRLSPFLAKPWVYNGNEFRIRRRISPSSEAGNPYQLTEDQRFFSKGNPTRDLQFIDQMTAFATADSEKPTFRIFHLLGIHADLTLDSELNYIGLQNVTPETLREQAKGMLKLLSLAFDRLEKENVYDNSLIFVIGDHGGGEYTKIDILQNASEKIGLNINYEPTHHSIGNTVIRGAIPAILAKPVGQKGSLKISASPVQLSDIPNTIFSELGFSKSMSGPSMFDIPENSDRIRTHRYYRFAGWGQDYIVPMTEYLIKGFSWNPGSWSLSGRDLNRQAVNAFEGQLVVLGEGGNLDEYKHQGWSAPMAQGRMMAGNRASVTIPYQENSGTMHLEIRTKSNFSPNKAIPMNVIINDENISVWAISKATPFTLETLIPNHLCQDKTGLNISFETKEDSNAPLIIELRVGERPDRHKYSMADTISFKSGGTAASYMGSGWSRVEDWGSWSNGFYAMINMKVGSAPGRDLVAETIFQPALFSNSAPMSVNVFANGEKIDSWFLKNKGTQKKVFKIPGRLIKASQDLDLSFSIPDPRQPKNYSNSTDGRLLGLGFKSLIIYEPHSPASVKSKILDHELLFNNSYASFKSGFNADENWKGKPVVWTQGMAELRIPISPSNVPTAVQITAELAPKRNGYLVACVNGEVAGAGPVTTFPWNGTLDLAGISISDQLRLVLYSNISTPQNDNPNLKDSRKLGLALSSIKLTGKSVMDIGETNNSTVLKKPYNLVLCPGKTNSQKWSNDQDEVVADGRPASRITGKALCTAHWVPGQPPRYILVDIARTDIVNSQLSININGFSVLANCPIGNNWCRMIDITSIPQADQLEITLTCNSPGPALNRDQSKDPKSSSFILRQMVLVQ